MRKRFVLALSIMVICTTQVGWAASARPALKADAPGGAKADASATATTPAHANRIAKAPATGNDSSPAQFSIADWKSFDEYARKVLSDWHVPGAAIAVVKDGKIVHAQGYGVRSVNTNAPVTPETVFAIGSCSKAFTALNIQQLADEGKLTLDSPVRKFLPEFALSDSYLSETATIKDLVSMRTGLDRAPCDSMMLFADYSPTEAIRHIKYIPQKAPYRGSMAYINQMFITAGEVVRSVSGVPWTEFVSQRIFQPLKMTNTYAVRPRFKESDNFAVPHAVIGGKLMEVPSADCAKFAPAGSINSTVLDMTKWLRLQLSDGTVDGAKVVSKDALLDTHYPVIMGGREFEVNSELCKRPEVQGRKIAYAQGWVTMEYRNRPMVFHSGGIDGMRSQVAILPNDNIGVVVLSNCAYGDGKPADAIKLAAVDLLLKDQGQRQVDWSQVLLPGQLKADEAEAKEAAARKAARAQGTKPSLAEEKYSGTYHNDLFDDLRVYSKDGQMQIAFNAPDSHAKLSHWQYDTFRAEFDNPVTGEGFLTFQLDADGKPVSVSVSALGDFRRVEKEKQQ